MLLLITQLLQFQLKQPKKIPQYLYVFHRFEQSKLDNIIVPRYKEVENLQTFLKNYL